MKICVASRAIGSVLANAAKLRPRSEAAEWPGVCPAIDHNLMTLADDAFFLVHDAFSPTHEAFFQYPWAISRIFEAIYHGFEPFCFDFGPIWCVTEGPLPEKRLNSLRN
ncbi:MAG: hypothetical protein AB2551_12585 [Candidatus Thiodiazotropha sp.]